MSTTVSAEKEPLKDEWQQEKHVASTYTYKEIPGFLTPFRRHCKAAMRRIITFEKSNQGVRRIGCNSWICQVCGKRKHRI